MITKYKKLDGQKLIRSILTGLVAFILVGQFFIVHVQCVDSDGDGTSDAMEMELAELYKPSLQFKADDRFVDLSAIATDYESRRAALGYTVYSRVTKESTSTVVQYWFFYAYNDAPLNDHEGDWEMIELILDSAQNPTSVAYSLPWKGQRASWGDVDKVDSTHPVVYVARGSHANYFRPYQGRLGLGGDQVGGGGLGLKPSNLTLGLLGEMGVDNHPSAHDWLSFGGR